MSGIIGSVQAELAIFKEAYKKYGFCELMARSVRYFIWWSGNILIAFYYRHLKYLGKKKPFFIYKGEKYNYLYRSYNVTWENERAVEVPIMWDIVKKSRGIRILEVGNVLRHYFHCNHDVVDLTEKYPGIINQDIVDFHPKAKYDLVISISTFEHIGMCEELVTEPTKVLDAVTNILENVLVVGGKFIITIPVGQNPELERYIVSGKLEFTDIACFKRLSDKSLSWKQVDWKEILNKEFTWDGVWCGTSRAFLIGTIQNI